MQKKKKSKKGKKARKIIGIIFISIAFVFMILSTNIIQKTAFPTEKEINLLLFSFKEWKKEH